MLNVKRAGDDESVEKEGGIGPKSWAGVLVGGTCTYAIYIENVRKHTHHTFAVLQNSFPPFLFSTYLVHGSECVMWHVWNCVKHLLIQYKCEMAMVIAVHTICIACHKSQEEPTELLSFIRWHRRWCVGCRHTAAICTVSALQDT